MGETNYVRSALQFDGPLHELSAVMLLIDHDLYVGNNTKFQQAQHNCLQIKQKTKNLGSISIIFLCTPNKLK